MRYSLSAIIGSLLIMAMSGWAYPAEDGAPYPFWDGKESIVEYAIRADLKPTKTLVLGKGVKLELVLIPAGKFIRGTPPPKPGDKEGLSERALSEAKAEYEAVLERFESYEFDSHQPAHEVTISAPYYLGKFEVTQEQYQQVMQRNPSHLEGRDMPVGEVSWENAQAFCKKVSEDTGSVVRLPTDAEWERACRAGSRTAYCTGDADADLDRVGWCRNNSKGAPHPVGQKTPNVWGLYDMHGNMSEWCENWFEAYKADPVVDPRGPAKGACRVLRGGSWKDDPWQCRSANRAFMNSYCPLSSSGFRVVVEAFMKVPDQLPSPPSDPESPPP